jgi:hypothetical protein
MADHAVADHDELPSMSHDDIRRSRRVSFRFSERESNVSRLKCAAFALVCTRFAQVAARRAALLQRDTCRK